MGEPIARLTMGHLIFVIYWTPEVQQAEVYDTHGGARNREQFEHIDTIYKPTAHIFDLIEGILEYGGRLDLSLDDIAI